MLPSGLPEHIADSETLSRFLTSDSQFNSAMAKASAFMPGPADDKTSVFRQSDDALHGLWATADQAIGTARRVRAVALLSAMDIRRVRLDVEAQEPPPRHANIFGWPSSAGDVEQRRAQRKELALLLAQAAKLVRR